MSKIKRLFLTDPVAAPGRASLLMGLLVLWGLGLWRLLVHAQMLGLIAPLSLSLWYLLSGRTYTLFIQKILMLIYFWIHFLTLVVLFLAYYLFLTPLAFFRRASGADPLKLRPEKSLNSYFQKSETLRDGFEKQQF